MKFLADENLPQDIVDFFKRKRYEIKDVKRLGRGFSDKELIKLAQKEKRVIVTYDKDFLPLEAGNFSAVVLNFPKMNPRRVLVYVEAVLEAGQLVRMRKPFVMVIGTHMMRVIKK